MATLGPLGEADLAFKDEAPFVDGEFTDEPLHDDPSSHDEPPPYHSVVIVSTDGSAAPPHPLLPPLTPYLAIALQDPASLSAMPTAQPAAAVVYGVGLLPLLLPPAGCEVPP